MDRTMNHDEIAALLGAFALDAVDPDEAEAIRAHLAECPRCSAEVAEHWEVTGLIANVGVDAPAEIWDRIAAQIDTEARDPSPRPAAPGVLVVLGASPARHRAPTAGVVGGGDRRGGRRGRVAVALGRAGGSARPAGRGSWRPPADTAGSPGGPGRPARPERAEGDPGRHELHLDGG